MTAFRKALIVIGFISFSIAAFGSAQNIYITQSGAPTGNCTTGVQTPAFFNNPANWGAGAAQIGPDTVVLICGTFTGAPNTTEFTFKGSGSAGHPIVLKFDTGAQLNAPYWSGISGAIGCTGLSYLTVDGNNSGIIQNTADGSILANQQDSSGIVTNGCSHITIQNITIQNIYVRSGTGSDGANTSDLNISGGDDFTITGNTLGQSRQGIGISFYALTIGAIISGNTLDYHSWVIRVGDSKAGTAAQNVNVFNNTIGPHFAAWADTATNFHADGIFYQCANAGSSFTNSNIYNNYIQSDMGSAGVGNTTALIFLDGECIPTGAASYNVYNNVAVQTTGGSGPEAIIVVTGTPTGQLASANIYNNTLVVTTQSSNCLRLRTNASASGVNFKNNVCSGANYGIDIYPNSLSPLTASDHNVFFNVNHVGDINGGSGVPTTYDTLAAWHTATAQDINSVSGNPKLSQAGQPQASSSAIGLGLNLYPSLAAIVPPIGFDKGGVARASSGACTAGVAGCWEAGAYQFSSGVSQFTPPAGLTAAVQ